MENTNFFAALKVACDEQNAAIEAQLVAEATELSALKTRKEQEHKTSRRNWAVGVLDTGSLPLKEEERIRAAMKIVATDPEVPRKQVEQLLLKNDQYRGLIFVGVVRDFLELGGDPSSDLGMHCIQRALAIPPGSDAFKGEVAEVLSMGLEILSKFNRTKRVEIARVYETLRKIFPFTRKGNLQNIPHGFAQQLYPEHYDAMGCKYRFASRHEKGEARKVTNNHRPRKDRPEESDKETWEGMNMAANGNIPGIRLIRAS